MRARFLRKSLPLLLVLSVCQANEGPCPSPSPILVDAQQVETLSSVGNPLCDGKPASSLRDAAEKRGVVIGSAINLHSLQDSKDPGYGALAAQQFSSLTPEYEFKFAHTEKVRGK